MLQIDKIQAFASLGKFIGQFSENSYEKNEAIPYNNLYFDKFADLIALSQSQNGWFTRDQVCFSLQSWAEVLTEEKLSNWLFRYELLEIEPKNIGLVLAGNIPLVGFHDFLCVLLSGHKVVIKTASSDQHLLPFLANYLIAVAPDFKSKITFVEGKLENFDAVIATGSNNTARYFEYYFKEKPSIIRKSRNSIAILNGQETAAQLTALGEDIFRYFGLGCRNVSKLYVPKAYDFRAFFEAMFNYQSVIQYEKYANNYDYNKAVFLMSNFKILDNGFLTIKEDNSHASPISSVFYEHYDNLEAVEKRLVADEDIIQCVVSNNLVKNSIPFGTTQKPELWDYADGIDTIHFLTRI